MSADLVNIGWFVGVIAALALLFAAGLKLPVQIGSASRAITIAFVVAAALAVVILANVALFRHVERASGWRERRGHLPRGHGLGMSTSPLAAAAAQHYRTAERYGVRRP